MKFKLVSEHRGSAVCHVLQDPLGGSEAGSVGGSIPRYLLHFLLKTREPGRS